VIVSGLQLVRPGMKVNPKPVEAKPEAPAPAAPPPGS
jgi:hypothetical protein